MLVKAIVYGLIGSGLLFCVFLAGWLYLHLRLPALRIPAAASESERLDWIGRWLQLLLSRHKFNGGVLIARDGRPLLIKAYGVTDHTAAHMLSTRTPFRLASVSKQFTAAGILVLAEQRRLALDDFVTVHLIGFPYSDVTIRHLLNQTSGIPDAYMALANEHRDEVGDVLRIADVVELLRKHPPERPSEAGQQFLYSNTNYVLLAGVIEAVSGRSFECFMRDELFAPLGMQSSRVWNRLSSDPFPDRASDFDQIGEQRTESTPTWIDGVAGDGAVFCSLEDFLIWDGFWRGHRLVSDDLRAAAFAPPKLKDGSTSGYGFGWVIEAHRVWHNGAWLGARTWIIRYPERNGLLVVLDNSSNMRIDAITRRLEHAIAGLVAKAV